MTQSGPLSFDEFKDSNLSNSPHYLVVGHPISHSLSPLMHNISLQHHSIDAEYIAVDLTPQALPEFIAWLNNENFLGCNITIPYKKEFLNVPDELSPEVHAVGAMNTVSKNESGHIIKGSNTDIYGFKVPLDDYENVLDYSRAIIFGSGGASLAVQYALMELNFEEVIIVSRSPRTVTPLRESLYTRVVDYTQWQSFADETELYVNTTPLGMGKWIGKSPVEIHDAEFLEDRICYDLVYNPLKTKFLSISESAGAETIGGLDMLIHQGSRSFEIWTGFTFPFEKVKSHLINHLVS